MPDVIIWMLRGEKRVAFARVPAHQILYSNFSEQACGKHCGRTQTIFMEVQDNALTQQVFLYYCHHSAHHLKTFFVIINRIVEYQKEPHTHILFVSTQWTNTKA